MTLFTGSLLLDVLGILTAIVVAAYTYIKWTFQYWQRRNIPYLEPIVPFGNFQVPYKRTCSIGDEIVGLYEQAKAKGWKYCGIYNMNIPNFMVLDLDLVKHILTKDFSNFVDRGMYSNEKADPLSAHLFNMDGIKWKVLRAKLTPTFTSGKMKMMFQTVIDTGLVLEKYLLENVKDKEPVDIKETAALFTTDIIMSCAFGLDSNSFKDPNSPFRTYGRRALDLSKYEVFKGVFANNFPNFARALGLKIVPNEVSAFFTKVVEDTVDYREKNGIIRKDFMQLLLEMKNNNGKLKSGIGEDGKLTGLTMKEICAQSFVFFLGGFETSSTTTTFALFQLATHPELQDKVRDEIRAVLAKHDNKITYDSLSELKYMKQVLDETLRMYPALPFITRKCGADYRLPGEDIIIEKGVTVLVPIRGIHFDERYYPNPDKFDPDRFSDENKQSRHHYANLPFGEGPRVCIGERFGIMQTKVGLTSILRRFRVKVNEKTKLPLKLNTTSIVPTTEGGVWLTLEKL